VTYKTSNYMLSEDFTYRVNMTDSIDIPKYSFVVPMDQRWVPKEVKARLVLPKKDEIYIYTKYGFIVVPAKIVRLAE
jgi:hypothetical protein